MEAIRAHRTPQETAEFGQERGGPTRVKLVFTAIKL